MAKAKTQSDYIKEKLVEMGGAADDWKRLSKNKNAQGQEVRVFENAKLGLSVEVTATGTRDAEGRETFSMRTLSGGAAPAAADTPATPGSAFAKVVAKRLKMKPEEATYAIQRIEETTSGFRLWFHIAVPRTAHYYGFMPAEQLQDLLRPYYGPEVDNFRGNWILGSVDGNAVTLPTVEDCKKRAGELYYIFDEAGMTRSPRSAADIVPQAVAPQFGVPEEKPINISAAVKSYHQRLDDKWCLRFSLKGADTRDIYDVLQETFGEQIRDFKKWNIDTHSGEKNVDCERFDFKTEEACLAFAQKLTKMLSARGVAMAGTAVPPRAQPDYFFLPNLMEEVDAGEWAISFQTGDNADPSDDCAGPQPDEVRGLFRKYYGAAVNDGGRWEFGSSEGMHDCAGLKSEEEALRRAGEIVHILQTAGLKGDLAFEEGGRKITPVAIAPRAAAKPDSAPPAP